MKGHVIICGAGRVGGTVATVLRMHGTKVIVIERDRGLAKHFQGQGVEVIAGDMHDAATLKKAGLSGASWLVAALGNDADNLYLVFKSLQLNPKVKVAARVSKEDSIETFYKAGAELIVMPELVGGSHLARTMMGLEAAERVELVESRKELKRKLSSRKPLFSFLKKV